MKKFFNTAGLCLPEDHYMVNPISRFTGVEKLIASKFYFTIHAPRQTGKTTYLHALSRKLNREGKHIALTVSFEQGGYRSITVQEANYLLNYSIYQAALSQLPEQVRPENPKDESFLNIKDYLSQWSRSQTLPVVLFVDEIDALFDDVLISVLRQFRDGYQARPGDFPSTIVLVGLRDVREYKAEVRKGKDSMGTASPFNIKSDSLLMPNFTKEEVFELLEQHTAETGQVFTEEAKSGIFHLAAGQPWLTNALAHHIVFRILDDDYSHEITQDHVTLAKTQLIQRRDTHLDSLIDKLKEDRVKRIVQTIINGDKLPFDILDDDIAYVRDLGIVGQTDPLSFANPIYAEIIPNIMASPIQSSIPGEYQPQWYIQDDGTIDIEKLLKSFQEFYSENAEAWLGRYEFKESIHHLLVMAFLLRIVNSGGEIIREMAVGNGRIDLLVKFGKQRFAMELKINRGKRSIEKAKKQLHRYLDRLSLNEGYLIIFDPSDKDFEEKLSYDQIEYNGKKITMVGV